MCCRLGFGGHISAADVLLIVADKVHLRKRRLLAIRRCNSVREVAVDFPLNANWATWLVARVVVDLGGREGKRVRVLPGVLVQVVAAHTAGLEFAEFRWSVRWALCAVVVQARSGRRQRLCPFLVLALPAAVQVLSLLLHLAFPVVCTACCASLVHSAVVMVAHRQCSAHVLPAS